MSSEASEWLNRNVLVGFTEKRGKAWHYRKSDQGAEPNHYDGPIPVNDVKRRLFAWEPVEAPVFAQLQTGAQSEADRYKAIVRNDTQDVLGIVSSSYTVHAYDEWLLENVARLVGPDSGIGSAGLLERGARAWVQVEVPETFDTPAGIRFRPFLSAATAMDGSMSTTYLTGAQVIVCDNTLRAALRDGDAAKLRVRHSARSRLVVDDARQALDLLAATKDAFERYVEVLSAINVTDRVWEGFLQAHFPLKDEHRYRNGHPQLDRRSQLRELWNRDERVAPWSGTAYGVVAAVNTYQHHVAEPKADVTRAERNASRVLNGRFDEIDTKAIRVLRNVMVADERAATALEQFIRV